MNESATNKVLTQYVIENANLRLEIETLKENIEELNQKLGDKENENNKEEK